MARKRLFDFRNSRGPQSLGLCQSDAANCAKYLNAADERLVLAKEAGDAGWWGTWGRFRFNVDPSNPYITTSHAIARFEKATICSRPVPIQNGFYEFLEFGNGTLPNICTSINCNPVQIYDRQQVVTFLDLAAPNKIIRVRKTDANDAIYRTLIQGEDANAEPIYTLDGDTQTQGVYLELGEPFADTPMDISRLTGIQKDATFGRVKYYEVDTVTGVERLILTMEPWEEVASYRRYYLAPISSTCCDPTVTTVQVEAMVKLELVPVKVDTDYTLIQNLEALIAECESIRYSTMDSSEAKSMARERHNYAIGLLQGELVHYLGKTKPAISFFPFGSAKLQNKRVGTLI
jgi:hypothetical protein